MGISLGVQSDHSKSYTINIKVPNPIVTFPNYESDENIFKELQADIQLILSASSLDELSSNYRITLHKLFTFLENSQLTMREKILKYISVAESKDILNQFSQLEIQTTILKRSFEILLSNEGLSETIGEAITDGLSAGQEILRYFSDENGILFQKYFLTAPCLVSFAGINKSFLKLSGQQDRSDEMTLLGATVENFKKKCIKLDNIKMLRTQSESYNVHDYSYEAQIRKDVSFGGKINDFYDKRPINKIAFRDHSLNEATDAG